MSVSTPRIEYTDALYDWHRTRLVLAGRSAILRDVEKFLPMTESQKQTPQGRDMYKIYTERATWYGGAARTLDAWVGTLTRKPLTVEVPRSYEWRLKNLDGQGSDINAIARRIVREVCAYARVGLLVDVGNAESAGGGGGKAATPYVAVYNTFSIISWRTRSTVEGVVLDQVILQESTEEPHPSGFGIINRTIFRVLELDEQGWYRSRLFGMYDGGPAEIGEPTYPTRGGTFGKLNFIPFVFCTPTGNGFELEKAPLQDVVDANISHFQTSADRDFSLYWSASPTVLITGLSQDDPTSVTVGSGQVIKLPTGATAGYMEFQGPGLAAMSEALKDKQQLMASLGVSILNAPKREAETYEALQLKSSGESASLVTIADAASKALTMALRMATYWGFIDGNVSVEMNRDLVNVRLGADEQKSLMMLYQSGAITLDILLYNLQQGEILPPGTDIEKLKDDILTQPPNLMSFRPPPTEREVSPRQAAKTDATRPEANPKITNRR